MSAYNVNLTYAKMAHVARYFADLHCVRRAALKTAVDGATLAKREAYVAGVTGARRGKRRTTI